MGLGEAVAVALGGVDQVHAELPRASEQPVHLRWGEAPPPLTTQLPGPHPDHRDLKGSPHDNLDLPGSARPGEWYSTWPSSQAGTPKSELERESEIEAAIEQAFSAIAEAPPEGVRSASQGGD